MVCPGTPQKAFSIFGYLFNQSKHTPFRWGARTRLHPMPPTPCQRKKRWTGAKQVANRGITLKWGNRDSRSADHVGGTPCTMTSMIPAFVQHYAQDFLLNVLASGPIPRHVAFVMDGNRRYARKNHKKVQQGHSDGFAALRRVRSPSGPFAFILTMCLGSRYWKYV